MLKLIKMEKNNLIYKSIPFLIFVLKWLDLKCLWLLKKLKNGLQHVTNFYSKKVSDKIDSLYSKKTTIKSKKIKKKVK